MCSHPLCAHRQSTHKAYTKCTHGVHTKYTQVHTKYTHSTHKVNTKYAQSIVWSLCVAVCCSVLHTATHCNTLQHSTHKVNTKYAQSIVWSLCLRRDCGIYSISEGRNLYCLHFGISQFMRPEAHSWIFVRVQLGWLSNRSLYQTFSINPSLLYQAVGTQANDDKRQKILSIWPLNLKGVLATLACVPTAWYKRDRFTENVWYKLRLLSQPSCTRTNIQECALGLMNWLYRSVSDTHLGTRWCYGFHDHASVCSLRLSTLCRVPLCYVRWQLSGSLCHLT